MSYCRSADSTLFSGSTYGNNIQKLSLTCQDCVRDLHVPSHLALEETEASDVLAKITQWINCQC